MRKVSLVLLALIVAAGTAFASDVTISGGVQQSWGFGDGEYDAFDGPAGDIDVDITAVVDDVNTVVIRLEQGPQPITLSDTDDDNQFDTSASSGEVVVEIDEAYFNTNLAAALDLDGVILQTRVGYWNVDVFDVASFTGIGLEDTVGLGKEVQAIQLEAGMTDLVTARFVLVPADGAELSGLVAVKGGFGPVTAEVFYVDFMGEDLEAGAGIVGLGAIFSDELVPGTLDLSAGFDFGYVLDKDEAGRDSDMYYGVGVSAGLLDGLATVGVSFDGQSEYPASGLGFDVNVAPVAYAGLDVAVVIALDDEYPDANGESFQYLEASAYLKPGAATFRVGYAYYDGTKVTGDFFSDYNAGGYIDGAESGFVFFNTSLSF